MLFARTAEECDRLFAACVKASDLAGLVSLYEPTACLVQRDGTMVSGHEALRKALCHLVTEPTEIRMHVVRVIDGDGVAAIYNDWVATRTTGSDGSATPWSGKAIEIVRRQADGRWLFVIDDPFARSRAAAGSDRG